MVLCDRGKDGVVSRARRVPATSSGPAIARSLVRRELADCEEEAVSLAELMISEVVTNAVVHGSSPSDVEIQRTGDVLKATVTDGGTGPPLPKNPGEHDPHGRGLLIVRSLAHEWGVLDAERGKSVWFTVQCRRAGHRSST